MGQNNSAQPEIKLVTSTPRLLLQIDLVQVCLFPPSFFHLPRSPWLQCLKKADPRDSWRVYRRTNRGLAWRSLLRVPMQTTQTLDFALHGWILQAHTVLASVGLALSSDTYKGADSSANMKVKLNHINCKGHNTKC